MSTFLKTLARQKIFKLNNREQRIIKNLPI